jgi:hypothetical protein
MRQRLLSYFTAACINLSIVSGTHPASLATRPAIVRVRDGALRRGRFDRRELTENGSVAVETMRATPTTFNPN